MSTNDLRIVPFEERYQQQVQDLVLGVQNGEFRLNITAQDQPDLPNLAAFYATGAFWVALDVRSDSVVGTIGIEPLNTQQAVLRKMFLSPALRGNKDLRLAQRLFDTLLAYAEARGFGEIWLDTPPIAHAAHRFYERNGFELMPLESVPSAFRLPKVAGLKIYRLLVQPASLDVAPEEFRAMLDQTAQLVVERYRQLDSTKGFNVSSQQEVERWFDEPMPWQGVPFEQLLSEVQHKVVASATGNFGKHMYAYVMSGGNQVSTLAEFMMATVNQNNAKWHLAPAMTEIEKRVVKWTAQMIDYTPEAGGAMVSGGSEANLAGLTVARNVFFRALNLQEHGLFGQKPFTIYCSTETHNCVDKSVALLGIGTQHIRKIDVGHDFTINLEALEAAIEQDLAAGFRPFCIVGNAGTVNTGAIDDLQALAAIAHKYHLWLHVDGAYGGLASSLRSVKRLYAGIELADSVALDFHKWLYQPYEIGCVLVKNWATLRETYFKRADYLGSQFTPETTRFEFNEHYFQLSRNAKAFKVWLSVKAYGFGRIQAMMQKDIDLTHYLAQLVKQSDDFVLKSEGDLAIACFQYKGSLSDPSEIEQLNQRLVPALEADGRVFITGTKLRGEFVLRACLINHRKDRASVAYLLQTIRDVAQKI